MESSKENPTSLSIQKFLGWLFIIISLAVFYWVFSNILALWHDPSSVPFVKLFVEKLAMNGEPIMSGVNGEIFLPENFQIIIGVFLAIVLLSSFSLLAKTFLVAGLCLLFPKIHFYGGLVETLIYRVRGKWV